jgi:hypothetical protein
LKEEKSGAVAYLTMLFNVRGASSVAGRAGVKACVESGSGDAEVRFGASDSPDVSPRDVCSSDSQSHQSGPGSKRGVGGRCRRSARLGRGYQRKFATPFQFSDQMGVWIGRHNNGLGGADGGDTCVSKK